MIQDERAAHHRRQSWKVGSGQRLFRSSPGQSSPHGSRSVYTIKTIHYYLTNWINGYLIVPILPHYIHHNHQEFSSNDTLKENDHLFEIGRGYYHPDMGDNSRLGLLLSLKAIVQLGANPIVALLCNRLSSGFTFPLIAGTVNIIGCSLRKKISV